MCPALFTCRLPRGAPAFDPRTYRDGVDFAQLKDADVDDLYDDVDETDAFEDGADEVSGGFLLNLATAFARLIAGDAARA